MLRRSALGAVLVLGGLFLIGCDQQPDPLPKPTELAVASMDGTVQLEWESGGVTSGRAGYYIYRDTASIDGADDELRVGNLYANTAHVDSTVTNGTTYYYRVAGVNKGRGVGPLSEEVTVTPLPDPPRP